MYPVSVITNVLSILDTFNTGVTDLACVDKYDDMMKRRRWNKRRNWD